jgi:hypothetical protein
MAGTKEHYNSITVGESHANISPSMKYVPASGLNLGGGMSHLSLGASINLAPTSMPAFFKPSINNGIRDILTTESTPDTVNNFVLVYDTDAKIGWYLPQACVCSTFLTTTFLSKNSNSSMRKTD